MPSFLNRLKLVLGLTLLLCACHQTEPTTVSPVSTPATTPEKTGQSCVNLNRATKAELMTLPGIGDVRAQQIIDYRERYGGFRRPQELIILDGFSEKKYRALADRLCVE